jgi:hypothetical protein
MIPIIVKYLHLAPPSVLSFLFELPGVVVWPKFLATDCVILHFLFGEVVLDFLRCHLLWWYSSFVIITILNV